MKYWYQIMDDYIADDALFRCPSAPSENRTLAPNTNHIISDCNNADKPVKTGMLNTPARYMMMLDCRTENGAVRCPSCGTSAYWTNQLNGLSDRHNNGSNAVFCDGHAEWITFGRLKQPPSSSDDLYGHRNSPSLGPGY
jgi:prepilin-type processing-associated H-X9-DG protein